jgi:pseudouridine-5'-phosphate glycosidase
VLGWNTATLPLFYSSGGGPAVSAVVSSPAEVGAIAAAHWALAGSGGLLLARPPTDGLDIEALIAEAVGEVAGLGVTGQAVTPAILTRIEELSGGRSVQVNQQLIADNATLAAEVAVAYAA